MGLGFVSEIFDSFQGEGLFAGRRHVFLRMAGCNIRCGYCDTPDSLVRTEGCVVSDESGASTTVTNPLSVGMLSGLLAPFLGRRLGVHALAITGGEPLVQAPFLIELLRSLRPEVLVLVETNATLPDRLDGLLPFVDIVSADVKLPSNSGERPFWDEHHAFLEKSRGKTLYVKVPVDEATSDDDVAKAARLVASINPSIPFFLQPIVSDAGEPRIGPSRLGRFYDLAVPHLAEVRVLPQTHKLIGVP